MRADGSYAVGESEMTAAVTQNDENKPSGPCLIELPILNISSEPELIPMSVPETCQWSYNDSETVRTLRRHAFNKSSYTN